MEPKVRLGTPADEAATAVRMAGMRAGPRAAGKRLGVVPRRRTPGASSAGAGWS